MQVKIFQRKTLYSQILSWLGLCGYPVRVVIAGDINASRQIDCGKRNKWTRV